MVGAGVGRIVMVELTAESQPNVLVCDTLIEPLPFVLQSTVIDEAVLLPMIDPPLTLHTYVLPAVVLVE
jgi:hypothetical protein